jgi:HemY protein
MAAIERGEGASDAVVKGWLARALGAPRGPQWCCDNCQHIHAEWRPVCENCHSFDTLSWRAPPDTAVSTPTGLEMLPLLIGPVGEPAKEEDDCVPDAEIVEEGESPKPVETTGESRT